MARRVFYSFHYKNDNWRAATVRNIGVVEGNSPASDNDWETVKKGGDAAIKRWIARSLGKQPETSSVTPGSSLHKREGFIPKHDGTENSTTRKPLPRS